MTSPLVSLFPRMCAIMLAACFAGACATLHSAEPGGPVDWYQWRGPNRDGISTEADWLTQWPKEGPKKLWTQRVGVGWSSVSVAAGRVYTMGNVNETDSVLCLDSATGGVLWRHNYPCSAQDPNGYPGTRCTPTLDGKLVFTLSRNGHLYCLNLDNGRVNWWSNLVQQQGARVPQWGFAGSPLVEGRMLLVETGAPGRSLIAFDKLTGKIFWSSGNDAAGYSSPVAFEVGGQRQIAMFSGAGISGRAAADGRILWSYPWRTSYDVNAATPIIFGDKVFISSGYGTGCALVQFGTAPVRAAWQNRSMRNHFSSCVLWQGNLYGFDESQLRCLDLVDGAVKWSNNSHGKGSLMLADGKLIIYGEGGRLAVADAAPAGYREISSAQVTGGRSTWAPPVLSNGKIYCRSGDTLICLDVRPK